MQTNELEHLELATEGRRKHVPELGASAFTLAGAFQILTACCIFFAILKTSPILAIAGTIIATPAIIRTSLASDLYRKERMRFSLFTRLKFFLESIGLTVVTLAFSAVVFVLISLAFGLLALVCSLFMGLEDLSTDVAVVGTIGGMVWGAAGAMLAFAMCLQRWTLKV